MDAMMTTSRVLLVEGTSGIGKSALADALVRRYVTSRPPRKLRTLLHLTQAHTMGPVVPAADAGTLTVAQNRAHLDTVATLIEWHIHSVRAEEEPKFFAVVDTLHVTHTQRPGVLRWADVASVDARLADMGVRMLFLRASEDTIRRRGIEPRRGQPFMTDYALKRFGPTADDVVRHFVREQDELQAAAARSHMKTGVVHVDGGLQSYLDAAFRFWLDD
jgi:hypothetical protein